jgi:hypothetical protein
VTIGRSRVLRVGAVYQPGWGNETGRLLNQLYPVHGLSGGLPEGTCKEPMGKSHSELR